MLWQLVAVAKAINATRIPARLLATSKALSKLNKLAFAVAAQDRVDIGRGNVLITGCIDNQLDEEYAEHISRAGASTADFDQIMRVNAPARAMCLKVQFAF